MRILLINSPYPLEECPRLLVTLPYLAAALREAGHEVEILDFVLAKTTSEKIEERMERLRPGLVGLTSVTLNHHLAEEIAKVVRKCDERTSIVMGGPHVSFEIEESFRSLAALDFIVIGEGERTIVELAGALEGRLDLRDVRGLALRSNDGVVCNEVRPAEEDLDSLPAPARDLLPLSRYLAFDSHASLLTSRGCPYECIFCSSAAWTGRRVRYRTPSLCVDEIEELAALGFSEITIEDELFTLHRPHLQAICSDLIRRNTGVRWNAFSRVDTITPRVVDTMAEAGCKAILFGVESGSQEMLDRLKKRSNLAKVRDAMRMTRRAGITPLASFIIGLPGETTETLRETRELAEELHREFGALHGYHILSPFPGTEVRNRAAEYGLEILTDDWRCYDANHVVSRPRGMEIGEIQAMSDEYDQAMQHYLLYQDYLFGAGRLEGHERETYVRRKRQSLLWTLLLDETIESILPTKGDALRELKGHVVHATGESPDLVDREIDRVLSLGALVSESVEEGVRFRWAE